MGQVRLAQHGGDSAAGGGPQVGRITGPSKKYMYLIYYGEKVIWDT